METIRVETEIQADILYKTKPLFCNVCVKCKTKQKTKKKTIDAIKSSLKIFQLGLYTFLHAQLSQACTGWNALKCQHELCITWEWKIENVFRDRQDVRTHSVRFVQMFVFIYNIYYINQLAFAFIKSA